ncbi:MAG: carbohydrate-binding domain-containing protein, partial [Anaerovorax sp.]|nr:carbohydrate-binding domain-containing protein [Anaerovorax sp.]
MKKQILRKPMALLLALIMVISLLPTVSLAAEEADAQVSSSTLATDGDVVVPSTTPTTIDLSAATENISITSGGDYTLTGSTTVYNVSIDTTDVENKIVNLTLDGASIQIPDDYNKKDVSVLSISGDATVNMIVKEGTCNTLSNVCTSGGIGVTVTGNSDLNITDTGTLNITGTSYTLYAKTGSSVSINDATVNIITSMNGKWVNCIELNGAALTVNSGNLNATIPEKNSASSMATSATIYIDSASSFTQNGGTVKVINQAKVTTSCYGIYDKGVVSINGGTLFAYGQTNGVHINSGLMGIDDDAVFLAASGNVATFDSMKNAV